MCLCALVPALNDGLLVVVDEVPSPITGGGVGKITMYVLPYNRTIFDPPHQ